MSYRIAIFKNDTRVGLCQSCGHFDTLEAAKTMADVLNAMYARQNKGKHITYHQYKPEEIENVATGTSANAVA